jgi:DNA-binding ferritin-like protein
MTLLDRLDAVAERIEKIGEACDAPSYNLLMDEQDKLRAIRAELAKRDEAVRDALHETMSDTGTVWNYTRAQIAARLRAALGEGE